MAFCGRSGFKADGLRLSPIQLLVLAALKRKPAHGYVILQLFRERLGEGWNVQSGTLYPALRSMEEKDLIEGTEVSQDGRPDAIQYKLTPKGQKILREAYKGLDGELRVFDNFWQFLSASAGESTKDILVHHTMKSRSPMAIVTLKRHCEAGACDAIHLDFLKEYREYLTKELEWVNKRLQTVKREGGEKR